MKEDPYNAQAWEAVHNALKEAGHPITGQVISTANTDNGQCFSSKAIRELTNERDALLMHADNLLTIIGTRKITNATLALAVAIARAQVAASNKRRMEATR